MTKDTKVRPTITVGDCVLIAAALDKEVTSRVAAGQLSNPLVIKLIKMKEYFLTFQPESDRIEALVQQRLAALQGSQTAANITANPINSAIPLPTADALDVEAIHLQSPLDNPALTDDQRFDLLALRDESQRTEAENKWYLNVGTFIRMARASKQPVDAGDL